MNVSGSDASFVEAFERFLDAKPTGPKGELVSGFADEKRLLEREGWTVIGPDPWEKSRG